VLDDCRRALAAALHDSGATLTHDALPTVPGDRAQLQQLLLNLLGNALKFRGHEAPRVHVGARREGDGSWRLSVTDNGIGIDPRFHDKIFTLFQRLHRGDYPGTGIGLAVCKKVVERHGGRIGVESRPGQGASFFFTLPAGAQAAAPTPAVVGEASP
jgi:chemotaxis family two-component system sensor kinase Cph1